MYYIVLDLEANTRRYKTNKPTEIVEISAFKLDSKTLKVLGEFCSLVKPSTSISTYTETLTGISDKTVQDAPTFPEMLEWFHYFLEVKCVIVTWGNADSNFLENDCILHNINWDMPRFIDLQHVMYHAFEDLFENTPNLKYAMEVMGLKWTGKAHRARTDARNTVKLFRDVMKRIDVNGSYQRSAASALFYRGKLNVNGRKRLVRWVVHAMTSYNKYDLTWEEFTKESNWTQIMSSFELNPEQIMVIKGYFETACENAKERLELSVKQ
ncbi:exonuclease domain-containing protein [Bacillus cereus]|uniref:exonuclease domain-containing protein n=1 Tax=Bacillus cereus TaxID=1396 RepID=UPI0011A06AB9|nr:exonuclease domain-containing protein [Bacillus cereus]